MPDHAFRPLAVCTRTPSVPRLVVHGFAIGGAQSARRLGRRLTWRQAARLWMGRLLLPL